MGIPDIRIKPEAYNVWQVNIIDGDIAVADFVWSDIGSWSAVWALQPRDPAGNATLGNVILDEVRDCLVFAEDVSIAVHGVSDLVIVATPQRVLVLPRASDQKVRDLADRADQA